MFIVQKLMRRKQLQRSLHKHETFVDKDHSEIAQKGQKGRRNRKKACADVVLDAMAKNKPKFAVDSPQAIMALLTHKEQRAIRVTWSHMKGKSGMRDVTKLMTRNIEKLVEKKPQIKTVFHKAAIAHTGKTKAPTMYDHARILAKYIDTIVNCHHYSDADLRGTKEIGEAHCSLPQCGFNAEMWEQFGLIFSEHMALQDCVRAYPYAPRAWNKLLAALTDQFRAYYDQRCRRISKESFYTPVRHHSAPNFKTMVQKLIRERSTESQMKKSQTENLGRKNYTRRSNIEESSESLPKTAAATEPIFKSFSKIVVTENRKAQQPPEEHRRGEPAFDHIFLKESAKTVADQKSTISFNYFKHEEESESEAQKLNKAESHENSTETMKFKSLIQRVAMRNAQKRSSLVLVHDKSQTDKLPRRQVAFDVPEPLWSAQSTPRRGLRRTLMPLTEGQVSVQNSFSDFLLSDSSAQSTPRLRRSGTSFSEYLRSDASWSAQSTPNRGLGRQEPSIRNSVSEHSLPVRGLTRTWTPIVEPEPMAPESFYEFLLSGQRFRLPRPSISYQGINRISTPDRKSRCYACGHMMGCCSKDANVFHL